MACLLSASCTPNPARPMKAPSRVTAKSNARRGASAADATLRSMRARLSSTVKVPWLV
ncbi:MAG: hypothetical protein QM820_24270 [Minicystis sp.]